MSLIVFQHSDTKTPGRLGQTLRDYGHRLTIIELHKNHRVPSDLDGVDGVISLGGSVNTGAAFAGHAQVRQDEIDFIKRAHDANLPVVGICLGAQLIATALGGEVGPMEAAEVGWAQVKSNFFGTIDSILAGIPWNMWQFQMHGQEIKQLPAGAIALQSSDKCQVQSYKTGSAIYGFQYHLELDKKQIENFLEEHKQLIETSGTDASRIKAQLEQHYNLYRQLSERLCENIASMIFPTIKTTWARNSEPVANYTPHIS